MFTEFKWKKRYFIMNGVNIFVILFACVRVYVSMCLRAVTSMHFPCRDTTCLVSQSD